MFNKNEKACPCAYCEYFKYFEYIERNSIVQKGFCTKINKFRELYDELCEEFVLESGIYTKKWYPNKKND